MTQLPSNSLSVTAETVRTLLGEADALASRSIDKMLEAGAMLVEAKAQCKHGEWLPFLERAGVPERMAQRYMTLARSGLKSDTVTLLGGIKAALEFSGLLSRSAKLTEKLECRGWQDVLNVDGTVNEGSFNLMDGPAAYRDIKKLTEACQLLEQAGGMFDVEADAQEAA